MDIALLGGTGDIGEGLALRWAYDTDHGVIIGSREAERAATKAAEYEAELASRGLDRSIAGVDNATAAERGDVVVAAVPPWHVADVVESVADALVGSVLVSPAVGMDVDGAGAHYRPPPNGSVTALVAEAAPGDVPVVGAFHNLAADRLANLDVEIDLDTLLVGDDGDAKGIVRSLAEGIEGLRALDAGPLVNAPEVESLTPLVISIARHNEGMHDVGVRFH